MAWFRKCPGAGLQPSVMLPLVLTFFLTYLAFFSQRSIFQFCQSVLQFYLYMLPVVKEYNVTHLMLDLEYYQNFPLVCR